VRRDDEVRDLVDQTVKRYGRLGRSIRDMSLTI
jgi:hypothetical protein